jgi:hypothetical protein
VQREIEAWGIPTISLSTHPPVTRRLTVPRWVHVRFPRGATIGEPGRPERQRQVLLDTLRALESIESPGGSVELPYRWEAPPIAWRGQALREGVST